MTTPEQLQRIHALAREFNDDPERYMRRHHLSRTSENGGDDFGVTDTVHNQSVAVSLTSSGRQMVIENINGIAGIDASNGLSAQEIETFKAANQELYAVFEAAAVRNQAIYHNESGQAVQLAPSR